MSCIDHGQMVGQVVYGKKMVAGRAVGYHRWAYCQRHNLELNSIKGQVVRHTCDNKRCINPDHLMIGSVSDNSVDAMERGLVYKLSYDIADSIRKVYAGGGVTMRELAKSHGVAFGQIQRIIAGKAWVRRVTT